MIDTAKPAFDQSPESVNGVGVNVPNYVHASTVIDSTMPITVDLV